MNLINRFHPIVALLGFFALFGLLLGTAPASHADDTVSIEIIDFDDPVDRHGNFNVEVEVTNEGTEERGVVQLDLFFEDETEEVQLRDSDDIFGLPAGNTETRTLTYENVEEPPTAPDETPSFYRFEVVADQEDDESDGSLVLDLHGEYFNPVGNLTVDPENVFVGDPVEITADITNNGDRDFGDGNFVQDIQLFINDQPEGEDLDFEVALGQAEEVSFSFVPEEEGEFDVEVRSMDDIVVQEGAFEASEADGLNVEVVPGTEENEAMTLGQPLEIFGEGPAGEDQSVIENPNEAPVELLDVTLSMNSDNIDADAGALDQDDFDTAFLEIGGEQFETLVDGMTFSFDNLTNVVVPGEGEIEFSIVVVATDDFEEFSHNNQIQFELSGMATDPAGASPELEDELTDVITFKGLFDIYDGGGGNFPHTVVAESDEIPVMFFSMAGRDVTVDQLLFYMWEELGNFIPGSNENEVFGDIERVSVWRFEGCDSREDDCDEWDVIDRPDTPVVQAVNTENSTFDNPPVPGLDNRVRLLDPGAPADIEEIIGFTPTNEAAYHAYVFDRLSGFELPATTDDANHFITIEMKDGWGKDSENPREQFFGPGDAFSVGMTPEDNVESQASPYPDLDDFTSLRLTYDVPPAAEDRAEDSASLDLDLRSPIVFQTMGHVIPQPGRDWDKLFGQPDENWLGEPGLSFLPDPLANLLILGTRDDGSPNNTNITSIRLEIEPVDSESGFVPREHLRELEDSVRSGISVWRNVSEGPDMRSQGDERISISTGQTEWLSDTEVRIEFQGDVELPAPQDFPGTRDENHEVNRGITKSNSDVFTFFITGLLSEDAPREAEFTARLAERGITFAPGGRLEQQSPYAEDIGDEIYGASGEPFVGRVNPVTTFPRDLIHLRPEDELTVGAPTDPEPVLAFNAQGDDETLLNRIDLRFRGENITPEDFSDMVADNEGGTDDASGISVYRLRSEADPSNPGDYDPDQDHRLPLNLDLTDVPASGDLVPGDEWFARLHIDHDADQDQLAVTNEAFQGDTMPGNVELGSPEFYITVRMSDSADNDDRFQIIMGQHNIDAGFVHQNRYIDSTSNDQVAGYFANPAPARQFFSGQVNVNTVTFLVVNQREPGSPDETGDFISLPPSSPPSDVLGIVAESEGGDQELEEILLTFEPEEEGTFDRGDGFLRSIQSGDTTTESSGVSVWINNSDLTGNAFDSAEDQLVQIEDHSWRSDTELKLFFPEGAMPVRDEAEDDPADDFIIALATSQDFRPSEAGPFRVTIERGDMTFTTEKSLTADTQSSLLIFPEEPFMNLENMVPDTAPLEVGTRQELIRIHGAHVTEDESDTLTSIVLSLEDRESMSMDRLASTSGNALSDTEPPAAFELWRSEDDEFDPEEDLYIPLESITGPGGGEPVSGQPVTVRVDDDAPEAQLPDEIEDDTRFFLVTNASKEISSSTRFSVNIEAGDVNTVRGNSSQPIQTGILHGVDFPPVEFGDLIEEGGGNLRAAVGDTGVRDHRGSAIRIDISDNELLDDEFLRELTVDLVETENLEWPDMFAASGDVSDIDDPDTPTALEVWRVTEGTISNGEIDPTLHDRLPATSVNLDDEDDDSMQLSIRIQSGADTALLPPRLPETEGDTFFVLVVNAGMEIQGDPENGEGRTVFRPGISDIETSSTTATFEPFTTASPFLGVSYPETEYNDLVGLDELLRPGQRLETFSIQADDYGGVERLEELELDIDSENLTENQLASTDPADLATSDTPAAFELWLTTNDEVDTTTDTYIPMVDLDIDPDFEDPVVMDFVDTPALDIAGVHPDGDTRFVLVTNASEQIQPVNFTVSLTEKALTTTNTTTSQERASATISAQPVPGDPQIHAVSFQTDPGDPEQGGVLKGNQFWAQVELSGTEEAFLTWEYVTESGDRQQFTTSTDQRLDSNETVFRFSQRGDELGPTEPTPVTVPLDDNGDSVSQVYLLEAWGVTAGEESDNRDLTEDGDSVPILQGPQRDANLIFDEIDLVDENIDWEAGEPAVFDLTVQVNDMDEDAEVEWQVHENLILEGRFEGESDWEFLADNPDDEGANGAQTYRFENVEVDLADRFHNLADGDSIAFRVRGEDEGPDSDEVFTPWEESDLQNIPGQDALMGIPLPEDGLARAWGADEQMGLVIFGGSDHGRAQDPTINPGANEELRVVPPQGKSARITIYTLSGHYVAEESGGIDQEVRWDGRSDSGSTVNNGVYVVKLEVGGRTRTFPVMVLQ